MKNLFAAFFSFGQSVPDDRKCNLQCSSASKETLLISGVAAAETRADFS